MKLAIVRIGNSKGIRLPKAVLSQVGFTDAVELEVRGEEIVLKRPKRKPREGWDEQFKAAIEKSGPPEDEELLLGDFPNEFDETEWTWPEEDLERWKDLEK
jgi:antitoxin MazE